MSVLTPNTEAIWTESLPWWTTPCNLPLLVSECVQFSEWFTVILDTTNKQNYAVFQSTCSLPNKGSAPQPLPTTSSRTRYVDDFTLNLHPIYQPAQHRHTPPSAPNNTCTTHPSHQTGTTHASVHPLPIHQTWKTHEADTSPTPRHTHLHMTFAYTHTQGPI